MKQLACQFRLLLGFFGLTPKNKLDIHQSIFYFIYGTPGFSFGDVYDILIVCSSHDAIDNQPYDNIIINEWNQVGKAKVFYVSNNLIKFKKIFDLLILELKKTA